MVCLTSFRLFFIAGNRVFCFPIIVALEPMLMRTWFHFGFTFGLLEDLAAPWRRIGAVLGTSWAALAPSQEA